MAQPYVGEIRMFGGNFAPAGWAFCEGQLMPISENDTLFTLIGTTYGGDGQETFALPNLQSRVPVHFTPGQGGMPLAEAAGVEQVTLTQQQIPNHTHPFVGSTSTATDTEPTNGIVGRSLSVLIYREATPIVALNAGMVQPAGGDQPHENVQPFLCLNFIISLFGIFPSQN